MKGCCTNKVHINKMQYNFSLVDRKHKNLKEPVKASDLCKITLKYNPFTAHNYCCLPDSYRNIITDLLNLSIHLLTKPITIGNNTFNTCNNKDDLVFNSEWQNRCILFQKQVDSEKENMTVGVFNCAIFTLANAYSRDNIKINLSKFLPYGSESLF